MADNEIRSQEWVEKIEDLVRQAESISDPKARGVTIDLLRGVLEFHAAGIERMLDMIFSAGEPSQEIVEQIAADELISSMLLLHDLHPDDLETRVNRAVHKLQEVFLSLGAKISLLAIESDTVRVGFDSQRTWSGTLVKASVEKAIFQAAPEITGVIIEGLKETPPEGFVPVSDLLSTVRV